MLSLMHGWLTYGPNKVFMYKVKYKTRPHSLYPPSTYAREIHYMYQDQLDIIIRWIWNVNVQKIWSSNVKNRKNDFKVAVSFVNFGA